MDSSTGGKRAIATDQLLVGIGRLVVSATLPLGLGCNDGGSTTGDAGDGGPPTRDTAPPSDGSPPDGAPGDTAPEPGDVTGGFEDLTVSTTGTPEVVTFDWTTSLEPAAFALELKRKGNSSFERYDRNGDGTVDGDDRMAGDAGSTKAVIAVHRLSFSDAEFRVVALDSSGGVSGATESVRLDALDLGQIIGYVKASNPDRSDEFGRAVAISGDGDTMAIGAPGESSSAQGIRTDGSGQGNNSDEGVGAVYLFEREPNGAWNQRAYVKASDAYSSDSFGSAVALSASGDTLAVGAKKEGGDRGGVSNDNRPTAAGAVYVFGKKSDGSWTERAKVTASNAGSGDTFGNSGLALADGGDVLAVGAEKENSDFDGVSTDGSGENDDSAPVSGAVYVFESSGPATWKQTAYVKATNSDGRDRFGHRLAMDRAGDTLVVVSPDGDSSFSGISTDGTGEGRNDTDDAGAAYVYQNNSSGWRRQAYLKASNTEKRVNSGGSGIPPRDSFGQAVSISADGKTIAVGAHAEWSSATGVNPGGSAKDDNSAPGAGAAYVFEQRSDGSWSESAYIKATNTEESDEFGTDVALSDSGSVLAVSANEESSFAVNIDGDQSDDRAGSAGAVYIYERDGGSFRPTRYVKPTNSRSGIFFGTRMALSGSARTLAVGGPRDANQQIGISTGAPSESYDKAKAGAVYLY